MDEERDPLESLTAEAGEDTTVIEYNIDKFFTLEEAAAMLPEVRDTLENAFQELHAAKDDVVLLRRMLTLRKEAGAKLSEEELAALREKHELLDTIVHHWLDHFLKKGIIVRDIERGLIDFPYQPTDPRYEDEVFFLCWQYNEDGLFYFHAPEDGFAGRKPIAVLPA